MNSESVPVQIHIVKAPDGDDGLHTPESTLNDVAIQIPTPSMYATPGSVLNSDGTGSGRSSPSPVTPSTLASPQSEWATPGSFDTSDKASLTETISMPALGPLSSNGDIKESTTPNGLAESSDSAMNGISVLESDSTPKLTPDSNRSVSSLSNMAAPPNTPQIVVGEVSILSPEDVDVTVYEKTPYGVIPAGELSRSSSGVKIVGSIEKVAQTEPEKGSSITYIAPEAPAVEEPAKIVDVVCVTATPFAPSLKTDAVKSSVDAVDGPTLNPPVAPAAPAVNGKSQVVVNGFGDDEGLVSEGPDCDDLLGSFLVRPCPSMRPYRRTFAKGFLVGLLIVVVAFIVVMILINKA